MFPQPRFSTLVPTPVEKFDASGCHLHYGPEDSDCLPPDEHFLGKQTNPSLPDGSIHYDFPEQARASDAPAMSGQSTSHVDFLTTTVFGHQDSVQRAANYGMSHLVPSYFTAVGSVVPVQFDSDRVTEFNVPARLPAFAQEYLGPFSGDAGAVVTSASSADPLATADMAGFPPGISRMRPFPIQFTNTAAPGAPQVTSQPSRRPCEWKNDQGGICGELVGWHCQDHLASVHGIVNISGTARVTCGACGEKKRRKFILRHFRERHIGFRRSKRNPA